jgi:hypothetical protein
VKFGKLSRLRWAEHVIRQDDDLSRRVLLIEPGGKCPRGRPRLHWEDAVEEDVAWLGCRNWKVVALNLARLGCRNWKVVALNLARLGCRNWKVVALNLARLECRNWKVVALNQEGWRKLLQEAKAHPGL